nr:hypothetical protein CFP56_16682 [Quercus suber]
MPDQADTKPALAANLLTLPRELRNEIYHHLFAASLQLGAYEPDEPPKSDRKSSDTFVRNNDSTLYRHFHPSEYSSDQHRHDSHRLALLATCKFIHTEAHLLALSLTPFHITGDNSQPELFNQLSRPLPPSKLHAIRHLTLTARVTHLRALNESWCGLPFGHVHLCLDTLTIVPRKPDASATCFGEIADLSQSHTLAYVLAETLKQLRNVRILEVRNHGCFNEVVWRIVYRGLVFRLWRWGGAKCGVRFECGPEGAGEADDGWFRVHIARMGDVGEDLAGLEVGEEIARLAGTAGGMPDPGQPGSEP